MPSTTTTTGASMIVADRATASSVLLGRTPLDRQLFAHDSVAVASSSMSSTVSPITTASPLNNFLLPTSGGESSSFGPQPEHMEPLGGGELDHSSAPVTTLYSFEELGRWTSDSNCTALIHALLASFSVILVSELGDKTFIITAIMAMKNSRSLVFLSSASALLIMTILSVGMGVAVTVVPELYTHYASIVLFLCFGLKMLKESYDMKDVKEGEESEFEEVKRSLEQDPNTGVKCETILSASGQQESLVATTGPALTTYADSLGTPTHTKALAPDLVQLTAPAPAPAPTLEPLEAKEASAKSERWYSKVVQTLYIAPIVIKVFTMIFVAEWGDRSQISTVILAAREDVVGVFIGSLSGHIFCTGLAVIGGRFVADMISVRTSEYFLTKNMTIIIIIFFAITTFTTQKSELLAS